MSSTRPHRHVLLVDRSLQLRYATAFGLAGAVSAILCGAAMFFFLQPSADVRALLHHAPKGAPAFSFIASMAVLVAMGLGLVGVLLTQRVAGPVYALTRQMSQLPLGRYPSFRPLRKGDELQELFRVCQTSVEYLRARDLEESFRLQEILLTVTPLVERSGEGQQALVLLNELLDRKRASAEREAFGAQPAPVSGSHPSAVDETFVSVTK